VGCGADAVGTAAAAQWGDQGLFKILRGKGECGIESGGYGGLPKV